MNMCWKEGESIPKSAEHKSASHPDRYDDLCGNPDVYKLNVSGARAAWVRILVLPYWCGVLRPGTSPVCSSTSSSAKRGKPRCLSYGVVERINEFNCVCVPTHVLLLLFLNQKACALEECNLVED